jgi:hypothetical protein
MIPAKPANGFRVAPPPVNLKEWSASSSAFFIVSIGIGLSSWIRSVASLFFVKQKRVALSLQGPSIAAVGSSLLLAKVFRIRVHPSNSCFVLVLYRFMFFTDVNPTSDSIGALASLVKSDRKAVESIAAILRAQVEGSESDFLRHVVIDLNRRTTKRGRSRSNI